VPVFGLNALIFPCRNDALVIILPNVARPRGARRQHGEVAAGKRHSMAICRQARQPASLRRGCPNRWFRHRDRRRRFRPRKSGSGTASERRRTAAPTRHAPPAMTSSALADAHAYQAWYGMPARQTRIHKP